MTPRNVSGSSGCMLFDRSMCMTGGSEYGRRMYGGIQNDLHNICMTVDRWH